MLIAFTVDSKTLISDNIPFAYNEFNVGAKN